MNIRTSLVVLPLLVTLAVAARADEGLVVASPPDLSTVTGGSVTAGQVAAPETSLRSFKSTVVLASAMLTSEGQRLEPGRYDLEVEGAPESGAVQVSFFRDGVLVGQTHARGGTGTPGAVVSLQCNERSPSKTSVVVCNLRDPGQASIRCDLREPAKAGFQCDFREPAKAGFQCDIREPAKARFQCDIREPAKAGFQCDFREPAKAGIQGDFREPAKDGIVVCNWREPAKDGILICDFRAPAKDGSAPGHVAGIQCDARGPALAWGSLAMGAHAEVVPSSGHERLVISSTDGLARVEVPLFPAGP